MTSSSCFCVVVIAVMVRSGSGCYVFPSDVRDPCLDKRCSFGARCVPSLDGLTARCQCPERCDRYGDSVDSTPICGSDGADYGNKCEMRRVACNEMRDIEKKYDGKCDPCEGFACPSGQLCKVDSARRPSCSCNMLCSYDYNPVCASDGRVYDNECVMHAESCKNRMKLFVVSPEACHSQPGDRSSSAAADRRPFQGLNNPCSGVQCGSGEECNVDRSTGRARCSCPPPCERGISPVCGSDGLTYDSECELKRKACIEKLRVTVDHVGQCKTRQPSPFDDDMGQVDPCAYHECPSGAKCLVKGTRAYCECPKCILENYQPVCGTDGRSYSNECQLAAEACKYSTNVTIQYVGLCSDACTKVLCGTVNGDKCVAGKCSRDCTAVTERCRQSASLPRQPVCANDGRTYPSECSMMELACSHHLQLYVVATGRCSFDQDHVTTSRIEETQLCDGKQPVIDVRTGLYQICDGPDACPVNTYCHRLAATSACCRLDEPALLNSNCHKSKFGCCPDDDTVSASGPNGAGCPTCDCDEIGSVRDDCEQMSGQCECKPGFTGDKCDVCEDGSRRGASGCPGGATGLTLYPSTRANSRTVSKLLRTKAHRVRTSSAPDRIRTLRHSDRSIAFDGNSFLRYQNAISKPQKKRQRQNRYEVRFSSRASDGLLLLDSRSTSAADFLAIGINDGHVEASWNDGQQPRNGVRSTVNVTDGLWHRVTFIRDKHSARLSVDDEAPVTASSSPAGSGRFTTDGHLLIGGCQKGEIPVGLADFYRQGLVGCVSHLRVGHINVHLERDRVTMDGDRPLTFCDD